MEPVDLSTRNHLDTSSAAQSLDGDRLMGSLRFPFGQAKQAACAPQGCDTQKAK
jgi:hypothetical protein